MMPRGISSIWAGFLGLGLLVTGCNLVAGLEGFHVTGGGGQGGTSAVTTGGGQGGTGATGGHGGAGGATTGTTSTGMMACSECPEPPDCKIPTCENTVCGIANAVDGSVAKSQVVGDCKKSVCMGGVATNVDDDMDPPEIAGDCKVHTCMSGGIVIAFEPMSTPCGVGGSTVCDGNGQCFGCTKAEDCVDLGACQKPSCDNGICGSQADATDIALDSNDCTLDLCTGPVPNHPSAMAGAACNGGASACDGAGHCLGFACSGNDCPSGATCVDGVCCDTPCDGLCQACTVTKKGHGLNGVCEPVALGSDPDDQCADQGALSCGTDGNCDGKGACHKYPGGAFVPTSFAIGGAAGASIQLADLNGDGKLDVIAAKAGTPQVRVLLNDGAGGLIAASGYGTNAGNQGDPIVVGDLNGDGKPDLVVPDLMSAAVRVLLNDGNGGFPSSTAYATNASTLGLPLIEADLDGDGKPELVVAEPLIGQVWIMHNNGNGGFPNNNAYSTNLSTVSGPILVGNLNEDTKPDLVATDGTGKVRVLLNNGNGAFPSSSSYLSSASGLNISVFMTHVNLDGKPDLVVPDGGGQGQVHVMLNDGSGAFPTSSPFQAGLVNAGLPLTFGDVNGDLFTDLIFGQTNSPTVLVLLNNTSGGFSAPQSFGSVQIPGRPLVLGDVNGDGHPDLVFTIPNAPSVGVMLNNGDGTFKSGTIFPTLGGSAGLTLQVGDMNGDGRPDLVTTNLSNSDVTILTNTCP